MFLPNATFWRMWGVAALLGIATLSVFVNLKPAHAETMRASFYGAESGRLTASGQRFNPMGFTAAHRALPFGTRLDVCFRACATVVVNDRGPAAYTGRQIDLSRGAARAIGLEPVGVAVIKVDVVGRGTLHIARGGHRHHRVAPRYHLRRA